MRRSERGETSRRRRHGRGHDRVFHPRGGLGRGGVAAARVVAGDCTSDAPRTTGGEDFAYMLNDCPGAYIQVGNGPSAGLHHPEYDFNDDLIPVGCSYWVTLAEQRLAVA